MSLLWSAARAVGDLLLAPFLWLPPAAALVALSVAVGIALLLAFRWLTPQRALRRTKDGMVAALYEMRVFTAAPRLVLRAQGRTIGLTVRYLALATPSLLVLGPLVGLVVTRASLAFEQRAFVPAETVLVAAYLQRPLRRRRLAIASELEQVPPRLHLRGGREVVVRLRARRSGRFQVRILVDGKEAARKRVQVLSPGTGAAEISRVLTRTEDPRLLLSHEPPLRAGPVRRVEVDYPRQSLTCLGLPWWLALLLLSLAVALALRRRLGVVL